MHHFFHFWRVRPKSPQSTRDAVFRFLITDVTSKISQNRHVGLDAEFESLLLAKFGQLIGTTATREFTCQRIRYRVPAAREFMDLTAAELRSEINLVELDLTASRCAMTAGKLYGLGEFENDNSFCSCKLTAAALQLSVRIMFTWDQSIFLVFGFFSWRQCRMS